MPSPAASDAAGADAAARSSMGHLRLSVGLEDTGDLLADLAAALDDTFGPR